jgi:hypothetical protein
MRANPRQRPAQPGTRKSENEVSGGTFRPFGVMAHVGRVGKNRGFDPGVGRRHGQGGGGQTTHPDTALATAPIAGGMMDCCLGIRCMAAPMRGRFMVQVALPGHRPVGRAAAMPGAAQHAHPRHRSRREGEKAQQQQKKGNPAAGGHGSHATRSSLGLTLYRRQTPLRNLRRKNVGLSSAMGVPCRASCCRNQLARENIVPDPCPFSAVHSHTVGAGDKDANRFALPSRICLKAPAPRLIRPDPPRRHGPTRARRVWRAFPIEGNR